MNNMETKSERSQENIVSSFFFYMWNGWSMEECKIVFGTDGKHFWSKWCSFSTPSPLGAAECFYSSLSKDAREKLVKQACLRYDDSKRIS